MIERECTPLKIIDVDPRDNQTKFMPDLVRVEEVASQLLFLGSKSASFINGQIMVIDGGLSLTMNNYQFYEQNERAKDSAIINNDK